jgi:hypothetical protein
MTATQKHEFAFKNLKTLPVGKMVKMGYATTALWDGLIAAIYHHGNEIATLSKETIRITHHGYNSNTTRDRLDQVMTANYDNNLYRVCKDKGLIALSVSRLTPVAFDTITLRRTGVKPSKSVFWQSSITEEMVSELTIQERSHLQDDLNDATANTCYEYGVN